MFCNPRKTFFKATCFSGVKSDINQRQIGMDKIAQQEGI